MVRIAFIIAESIINVSLPFNNWLLLIFTVTADAFNL